MSDKRYPATADEAWEAAWSLSDAEREKWALMVRAFVIEHAILTEAGSKSASD
jgi:hypothetical protein